MDNEIQILSTKLEELKKRLKAINTSQNVLSKLITIQDYFDQIQSYLNDLNHAFNNHVISCDEHDQLIKELQEQINSINLKLESLPNIEDYNIEQMSADIESLKQDITDITAEITAIKGNSNSTIETIDNKLTELNQTLEELITKVNANTSDISSLKTTMQGLSTTQDNLSSSVSSLTLSLEEINTKVTNNETNISSLNTRVITLESDYDIPRRIIDKRNLIFHLNSDNLPIKSRIYYYSAKENSFVKQHFKLNYTSVGEGILTITLIENDSPVNTYTFDLSQNPDSAMFETIVRTTELNQTFQLEVSSTTHVLYSTLDCTFDGINVLLEDYDVKFKMRTCTMYKYFTEYDGSVIKFGLTNSYTVNPDKLYKWQYDDSNDELKIRYAVFSPWAEMEGIQTGELYRALICEKSDGNIYFYNVNLETGELTLARTYTDIPVCKYIETSMFGEPAYPDKIDGVPVIRTYQGNKPYTITFKPSVTSRWLSLYASCPIYMSPNSYGPNVNHRQMVGLNEDGYFYSIIGTQNYLYTCKLGKGDRCLQCYSGNTITYTAIETNGDVILYINKKEEITHIIHFGKCEFFYLDFSLNAYYKKDGVLTQTLLSTLY